ncbi:protein-lysine N-methyltransferase CG9154 [Musca vetustissima]|uniref:protein-lysine N-methyltransferase CG9154 n=1 Tax=Musca vetustissima TaxID=27455 RepID=UPI002AB6CA02|nr:protein-lysine N-methyltransferase CG9154 [Musca vetustissima]
MEDDDICLPADTMAILQQFLAEKAQREQEEMEKVQQKAGKDTEFEEDWQLSQFWYSNKTKQTLGSVVSQLVEAADGNSKDYKVALLSCPSLYGTIKEIHENVNIFEYDKRFSAYGDDFVFYDFNEADIPDYLQHLWHSYDFIIADPPFLSEECITKISKIIKNLLKPSGKIIFCSGEVVEQWLVPSLPGVKKCNFHPEHERNLGNEFVSYANFNLDDFIKT